MNMYPMRKYPRDIEQGDVCMTASALRSTGSRPDQISLTTLKSALESALPLCMGLMTGTAQDEMAPKHAHRDA